MRGGSVKQHIANLTAKLVTHRSSTLAASPSGRLVQNALTFIRKNSRKAIRPKDVAAHLGISRPLLDLRFRELIKTSVGKTIEAERMNAVCAELSSTGSTIKEIAERCSYADPSQLMHRFKHHFGMTMRDWRKQQIAPKQ